MDSENNDYDIVPINNSCKNTINSNLIVSSPGSQNAQSNQNIDSVNTQHTINSQYDNVDNITVQSLYSGGNSFIYSIKFRNKIINIESSSEKKALKIFLKNKNYKKDHILEIIYKNKSSIYMIKGNIKGNINKKTNKIKKII